MPLLVRGMSNLTLALYLVSLLLPAPTLAFASFLLRYRQPQTQQREKKSSVKSTSTHRSLALLSESQLSLPISVSPKLTPPAAKRSSTVPSRMSKLLEPKPSISNFGYDRDSRHQSGNEDEAMRRTLARRSGDVWIESGHAIEGGGLIARAAEMLKPVPAMRVLCEAAPTVRGADVLTRLRGGVVSMLPKRWSGYDEFPMRDVEGGQTSSITISVTSPSKFERQTSRIPSYVSDGEQLGDMTMPSVEIRTATRARMSSGPTFFYGRAERAPQDDYDVDWLTAGVLPK